MKRILLKNHGMTLVEMLVAMAASLLLMAAIARAFAAFSGAMSNSRTILETDSRLRAVARRLRDDLKGATAEMLPPMNPGQGRGYFEIFEGPNSDLEVFWYFDAGVTSGDPRKYNSGNFSPLSATAGPGGSSDDRLLGDIDDALLFTTKSLGSNFVGRSPSGSIESSVAEVAWFLRATPGTKNPVTYTLYRRQLLVMGYMDQHPFTAANGNRFNFPGSWSSFYVGLPCDISARRERSIPLGFDVLVPNTLSDLTRRESRFHHNKPGDTAGTNLPSSSPYPFVAPWYTPAPDGLVFDGSTRQGEDVVLTNILAFDVRVFDPAAPVKTLGSTAIGPGDDANNDGSVDWRTDPREFGSDDDGSGAYVDIGYDVAANSQLGRAPHFQQLAPFTRSGPRYYCTFSTHYEANGLDEDGDGLTDEGVDGIDNDSNSLVDDADEQETSPPYPYPLRGLEVRIRVYEPFSRQVRQVTVRHTFVPH